MSNKATKLILKRSKKLDKIYHPESGLVFKSATEKIVIGRIADEEFISLDEVTIALCEQYGQEYDKSLVEEVEEGDNQQEADSQQEADDQQEADNQQEVGNQQEADSEEVEATIQEPVVSQSPKNGTDVSVLISSFSSTISSIVASKDKALFEKDKALHESMASHKKDRETFSAKEKEFTETISKLQKELDDVKKKLKGVLLAMQGEL